MFMITIIFFLLAEVLALNCAEAIMTWFGTYIGLKWAIITGNHPSPAEDIDVLAELEKLKLIIAEFEKKPDEVAKLKKKISDLNAAIHQAYITEQRLRGENASNQAAVEKYRREAESVRAEMQRSEELLKSELDEVVRDLMDQEGKRREKIQEERDEDMFDKLSDVSDVQEACLEV